MGHIHGRRSKAVSSGQERRGSARVWLSTAVGWLSVQFSTIVLLVHLQPIHLVADVAAETTVLHVDVRLQLQMVVASGATLVVLLVLTVLSVYKPQGLTPYGWRKQHEQRTGSPAETAPLS